MLSDPISSSFRCAKVVDRLSASIRNLYQRYVAGDASSKLALIHGSTYLAMNLAIAVGQGGQFLNRQFATSSVLYLDYENPDHEIRSRLLKMAGGSVPGLKIWAMASAAASRQQAKFRRDCRSNPGLREQTHSRYPIQLVSQAHPQSIGNTSPEH